MLLNPLEAAGAFCFGACWLPRSESEVEVGCPGLRMLRMARNAENSRNQLERLRAGFKIAIFPQLLELGVRMLRPIHHFNQLFILFDLCHFRFRNRILRWAGHVARMPMSRAPRQLLTGWVSHSRPIGCPQMTWGRTLENALKSKGISKDFDDWIAIAKDRSKWRQLTHSIPKLPDA